MTPETIARAVAVSLSRALGPVRTTIARLEERLTATVGRIDGLEAELTGRQAFQMAAALDHGKRIGELEGKAAIPGPPGPPGLGFDDLMVRFDGERTVTLELARDGARKAFPIVLPILCYQGIYTAGQAYARGDVVTWGGSAWVCQADTVAASSPHDGSKAWQLMVKRGRDARDGAR